MDAGNVGSGGLSIKKFDGKNYKEFRFLLQNYLENLDLWDVIVSPKQVEEEQQSVQLLKCFRHFYIDLTADVGQPEERQHYLL